MVESADMTVLVPYECLRATFLPGKKFAEAWQEADEALAHAVQGLIALIRSTEGALLDGDFECLRPSLQECGLTRMGFGTGATLYDALKSAMRSPLLGDGAINRARTLILNLGASDDTPLAEVNTVLERLVRGIHRDAKVIWSIDIAPGLATAVLYATDFE